MPPAPLSLQAIAPKGSTMLIAGKSDFLVSKPDAMLISPPIAPVAPEILGAKSDPSGNLNVRTSLSLIQYRPISLTGK